MSNDDQRPADDAETYGRPNGVDGGFAPSGSAPRPQPRPAPHPTAGEQQVFGRPGGVDGGFVQRPAPNPQPARVLKA